MYICICAYVYTSSGGNATVLYMCMYICTYNIHTHMYTPALAETLPWAPSTSHATSTASGEPLAIVRVRQRGGASMAAGGWRAAVRHDSWRLPATQLTVNALMPE